MLAARPASSCCIRHQSIVCVREKTHSSFCTGNCCSLDVTKQWQPKQQLSKKLLMVLELVHSGNTLLAVSSWSFKIFDLVFDTLTHKGHSYKSWNFQDKWIIRSAKTDLIHVQTHKSSYPEEGSPSLICVINIYCLLRAIM